MSTANDYRSCQIFVRGTGRQFLAELVAVTLGAQIDDHYTVRAGRMVFDTRPNPDAGLADDFIGWPLTIEAEAEEDGPSLVEPVSRLLTAAWAAATAPLPPATSRTSFPSWAVSRATAELPSIHRS